MRVTNTNDERYPIEISNSYEKVSIDNFVIEDDEEWEDFINQLNQYREGILNGYFKNFSKKNSKKGLTIQLHYAII